MYCTVLILSNGYICNLDVKTEFIGTKSLFYPIKWRMIWHFIPHHMKMVSAFLADTVTKPEILEELLPTE